MHLGLWDTPQHSDHHRWLKGLRSTSCDHHFNHDCCTVSLTISVYSELSRCDRKETSVTAGSSSFTRSFGHHLWNTRFSRSVSVLTYWHKHERTFTHSRAEVKDTIIKHKLKQEGFHRITPTGRVRPFHSSGAKSQTVVASGFKIRVWSRWKAHIQSATSA